MRAGSKGRAETHAANIEIPGLWVTPPYFTQEARNLARPCSTCKSTRQSEIERRIREERSFLDISRWLDEVGEPISNVALAKHAKEHMAVTPRRGARPYLGGLAEAVAGRVAERLEAGELEPGIADGLKAEAIIKKDQARNADRDIVLKITMALTGHVPHIRVIDPEVEAIEAEFRPLLTPGD